MAQFDWYQASVDCPPRIMADALMSLPGAHEMEHGRGRLNYSESCTIRTDGGDAIATVLHGGKNRVLSAVASGDSAPAFAALIRSTWPDAHRVTRVDTAQDVRTDFGTAHAALQVIAATHGIKGHSIIPDDPADGATYYMGASTSSNRLRLYEKGKQSAKLAGTTDGFDLGSVRFEAQLRPVREGRLVAAKLSPDEAWGSTGWLRTIARQNFEFAAGAVVMHGRMPTSVERSERAMFDQYGGVLRRMHSRFDTSAQFGEAIAAILSGASLPD